MIAVISGFIDRTVRGWIHAGIGAVACLLPMGVGLVAASPQWPAAFRVAGSVVAFCAVTMLMGTPAVVRRGCVRLADQLLGTRLPAPPPSSTASWGNRLRTSAYLGAHMVIGTTVTVVTGLSVLAAAVFVVVWAGGGGQVDSFGWDPHVPSGWQGGWAVLMSVGWLGLAVAASVVSTAVTARLARALLGSSSAERLANAQEQLDRLAQRNRLAQELHDSIGHTLTASTIQAAVAGQLMDSDPSAARRALVSIEETSRAAMDDLDHVLGVLREEDSRTTPPPTLADLDAVAERVRQAGAELRVTRSGDLDQVDATVSREAYRIVQEGLTNALRHSDRTDISLRVQVREGWLEVEVVNPLDSSASREPRRSPGYGLAGIGERVRLLRGEMSAGSTGEPGTDWRLLARIPLRSTP